MRSSPYILIILLLNTYFGFSQTAVLPVNIPVSFSGNFGELRSNHFHSGLDFKTQGRTGIPVRAVKDGYISRINVSPYGFGRALYIDHPDGTTTVYGHLDRFAKDIESFTLDSQYVKQSFRVDMSLSPRQFPVKQGEIIALSGNTGSSGGPHLHFELRNTKTEEPHDPLSLYVGKVKDTRKPEIRSFMLYPEAGKGLVNGKPGKQALLFKKDKKGNRSLTPSTAKVWGRVGFAVKAYDYMDNASNILGVKEVILNIDGKTVCHSDITHFAFSESRFVNSFIDWEEWVYRKELYMKSFIEPGNRLRIYRTAGNGIFNFNEERNYKIQYILKDLYGNTTEYSFTVRAEKQAIPAATPSGILFPFDKDNVFEQNGVSLSIPRGNLYTNLYFDFAISRDKEGTPLFKIGKRAPLHTPCPLTLPLPNDNFPLKEKYGIVHHASNKKNWIGGSYENGRISTRIRELGDYSIDIDTVAPKIVALNKANWAKNKEISFKVTDDMSGVSSWKGTLDGQFVLFEFDAKRSHLFCKYDPKRMKSGKVSLRLEVKDGCDNHSIYEEIINW